MVGHFCIFPTPMGRQLMREGKDFPSCHSQGCHSFTFAMHCVERLRLRHITGLSSIYSVRFSVECLQLCRVFGERVDDDRERVNNFNRKQVNDTDCECVNNNCE